LNKQNRKVEKIVYHYKIGYIGVLSSTDLYGFANISQLKI